MSRSVLKKRAKRESGREDYTERLVTLSDPLGASSEAYRALRTSLLYALADTPPKVIMVTSPGTMEGKSTTCANLGVALAQAEKRVLMLDCDLRKPTMHKIFGLRNMRGLVNVVVGERDLQEVLQEPLPGLKVASAGPIPPNPAELLGSKRFGELLRRVREEFDFVLIDAPPTELVSDPAIIATQGDGVLLVFDSRSTRKAAVRKAVRRLEAVGAKVLGTVMNNVKLSKGSYQSYGYTEE